MNAPSNCSQYDLSIVVPTHNRKSALNRLLLSIQQVSDQVGILMEVLIVDSSKRPSLKQSFLAQLNKDSEVSFLYFPTGLKGVNAKRNLGLSHSRGVVTLFLDDDCEVRSPQFLKSHFNFHISNYREEILGGSYDNVPHGLIAKAYNRIYSHWRGSRASESLEPFVGGNLSLKTDEAAKWLRFDESMIFGGTERELILRATASGCQCRYFPQLKVAHHLRLSFRDLIWKAFMQGRGEAVLWRRYPSLLKASVNQATDSLPTGWLTYFYDLAFRTGVVYGSKYGLEKVKCKSLFRILYHQLFVGSTSEGEGLNEFSYLKDSLIQQAWRKLYWRTLFPIKNLIRLMYGRVWLRIYGKFISPIYWKFIFPLKNLAIWIYGKILVPIYWKVFAPLYWKALFPLKNRAHFIYGKILVRLYWKLLYRMGSYIYWNIWWKVVNQTRLLVRGDHQLIYKLFNVYHGFRLYYGYKVVPVLVKILKPYYFLRFQCQKRMLQPLRAHRERNLK